MFKYTVTYRYGFLQEEPLGDRRAEQGGKLRCLELFVPLHIAHRVNALFI